MLIKILAITAAVLLGAFAAAFLMPSGEIVGVNVTATIPAVVGGALAGFLAWRFL